MLFIWNVLESFICPVVLLSIFELVKDPENMAKYEKEFIDAHEHEWDHCIPSGFDTKNSRLMNKLCEIHVGKKKLEKIPAKDEYHHLNFKKVPHHAFFVEVIRCSDKFAVIKAPDNQCAYLLKRGPENPDIGDVMFLINKKFCYYVRDLTFNEAAYLKEMARTLDEPILNREHRVGEGSTSLRLKDGTEFGGESPDDIPLSTLFDESEESFSRSEASVHPTIIECRSTLDTDETSSAEVKSTLEDCLIT